MAKSATGTSRPRMKRRLLRWGELAPLFDLAPHRPDAARSLSRCADVADVRLLARRRVPRMVFDFVDGGSGSEASVRRARELFQRLEFEPRVLRDVRNVDISVEMLGQRSALPFFFAPTGATRLMHAAGESAVARVAGDLDVPYTLSTLGTTSVEDLAAAAPSTRRWFQLYLSADRAVGESMVQRAWDSGFDTLMLAVDCPVPGRRNRDVRNGLVVPPKLTWGSALKIAGYPRWWFDKLTTAPIEFAMISAESESPAQRMARVFDPSITIDDVAWLRGIWPGKLVAKGILSAEDAKAVVEAGVDAVYLSSHGGRQLDLAPLPIEILPAVREVVGDDVEIFVDGGAMTGSDIVACYAAGADAVGIGRAYLYGLMAAGEAGVRRVADLLAAEVSTALALLGCVNLSELPRSRVRVRQD